ncbi:MAG: radical SAM protein [Candidatus Eisenbacteria sp.]|nr:radical SAM protein [Candidatus Eisenbacteria bacterium]
MKRFEFGSRARQIRRYLGIVRGRPLMGPQVVSLEVTHHCNLSCSFCESHGRLQAVPITARRPYASDRWQMDLETVQRLAGELAVVGTDLVELSGKGEPMTHPQLSGIIAALTDAGEECALVTNGTLARPDLAATLVARGLLRLSVSLNAGSREVYRRTSSRDLWNEVLQFLGDVIDARRRQASARPWIQITHVVTRENTEDMERMGQVCADLGVDEVAFLVMGELPETKFLQLGEPEVETILAQVDGWGSLLRRAGVAHNLAAFSRELLLRVRGGRPQLNPLQQSLCCYEGWVFTVIAPDGVVTPCCYCEEEQLGNIYEQGFDEIWYGRLYRTFRRKCREMPCTHRPICRECFTSCNVAAENLRIHKRICWAERLPFPVA